MPQNGAPQDGTTADWVGHRMRYSGNDLSISTLASDSNRNDDSARSSKRQKRRPVILLVLLVFLTMTAASVAWVGYKAMTVKSELEAAEEIVPVLKDHLLHDRKAEATDAAARLKSHTTSARFAADDPLWTVASATPWIGQNLSAAAEIARSADDVANLGVAPLVRVFDRLNWNALLPAAKGSNLVSISESAPAVESAAHAVRMSASRLHAIDVQALVPEIALPLLKARDELSGVQEILDIASDASKFAPQMLGQNETRRYLLLVQNSAEARATGGIPGALAVVTVQQGKLTLGQQSSAVAMGVFDPPVQFDAEQKNIYSARVGKFAQDVNLTPHFPTSAATAASMWQQRTGEQLDGVVSVDPVALGYILDATGPIELTDPKLRLIAPGLPAQLTGDNVVKTLLSDVYAHIEEPAQQDTYFAVVAGEIFSALSSGRGDAKALMDGMAKGVSERRILLWSAHTDEQKLLKKYPLGGSVVGEGLSPSQFGVYFNDGTGAKMDYYVKRTVQLIRRCPVGDYSEVVVRVTSTNRAPADAATSLPEYVTGRGAFGIPPGTVQTNVVAYGPAQAHIETATQDGQKTWLGSQRHDERPVGTVTTRLAPGQSSTVEFTFSKIVQHTEPELVVTPTTEPVKNVALPTQQETCNSGQ